MLRIISRLSVKGLCLVVLLTFVPAAAQALGPPPLTAAEKPYMGKWHAVAEGETPPYVWDWFDLELREDRTGTITHPYKGGLNIYGRDYWRLRVKRGYARLSLTANIYAGSELMNVEWLDADTITFSWTAGGFAGNYTYKAKRVK